MGVNCIVLFRKIPRVGVMPGVFALVKFRKRMVLVTPIWQLLNARSGAIQQGFPSPDLSLPWLHLAVLFGVDLCPLCL